MTTYDVPHPPIVSREHWLVARKKLLAQEKELTRQYDRVNAVRRRLPMVKIEKNYMFDVPGGEESLLDLFQGPRQLAIYHFMFHTARQNASQAPPAYATPLPALPPHDNSTTTPP